MSDTEVYAKYLEKKFTYTNTFYHKEPKLDITHPGGHLLDTADFIISSDVFEHVPPPVSIAFDNLFKISKKGGLVVFSVPFAETGDTIEHFPGLHDFKITGYAGKRKLINTTADGEVQTFDKLHFHGGCGSTLEMRVFSKQSLTDNLTDAGFQNITIHDASIPEHGILFDAPQSPIVTMHKQ